ncbi:MAG: phage minor tail protein L [Gammaproteobacteria bacterium]|nr:MAG: phage minor tail protein L [Gammaproteobacteria bacterium]
MLKRRRTLAQYLGTETPDSSTYIEDVYFIEQKSVENSLVVEFTLSSAMDFIGKRLPGRTAVANTCPWQYKTTENGSGCGWPGNDASLWFDASGNPVNDEAQDACGKRLSDCKLRFGEVEPLDFGGFPSLGRI